MAKQIMDETLTRRETISVKAEELRKGDLLLIETGDVIPVGSSFAPRLGIGGMPFLLPLLYQVGMGFTPVQAALLIVPQPLAAMTLIKFVTRILQRFGYRRVRGTRGRRWREHQAQVPVAQRSA